MTRSLQAPTALISTLLLLAAGCTLSMEQGIFNRLIALDRSASHLTVHSVDVDGIHISYLERPGPGETIVLIHGFSADKDNWIRFARYLPREYRVIALDLPGHGDSGKPLDKTYNGEFYTESFAHFADALNLSRFHLAGNCMGGFISLLYASRNPGRVKDLCLIDTAGFFKGIPRQSDFLIALSQGKSPLAPANSQEFDEYLNYAFHEIPFMPWPVKTVLEARVTGNAPFMKKIFNDIHDTRTDPYSLLPGLHLPVLVIWGANDRIIDVSTTSMLAKGLPDKEIVIIKNCGHLPMLEKPKRTAREYKQFLDGHKGKS
jgi:abhydrolase domain-containing protein 6